MRKPTFAEAYMYKNLFWIAVGVFAFVPFLNDFLFQFLYLYTEGDIAYGNLGAFISTVKSFLSFVSVYIGLGVLAVTVINFGKNAVGVIRLAFITHGVTFLSSFLTCGLYSYVSYGYFLTDDVLMQTLMLIIDGAVNLIAYLLIYLMLIKITVSRETVLNTPTVKGRYTDLKHPLVLASVISIAIHSGARLLTVIYSMITAFNDPSIGPPVNAADIMYWVLQYLSVFAFMAIGTVIAELIILLSEHYLKMGKRKKNV